MRVLGFFVEFSTHLLQGLYYINNIGKLIIELNDSTFSLLCDLSFYYLPEAVSSPCPRNSFIDSYSSPFSTNALEDKIFYKIANSQSQLLLFVDYVLLPDTTLHSKG
jgi:hypothetical protein